MASSYYTTNAIWESWNTSNSSDATVWGYWNRMTVTTNVSDNTWYVWNTENNDTAGTNDYCYDADNIIWGKWNVDVLGQQTLSPTKFSLKPQKRSRSDRKKASREYIRSLKQSKKQDRKAKIHAEEKRRAELKAQELLFDLIGEKQSEVFKDTGRLLVKGEKFDWLISKKGIAKEEYKHVMIQKVKKDKVIDLCVRIDSPVPPSDKVIAFALRAKYDEEAFEKTANTTRVNERQKLPECANF